MKTNASLTVKKQYTRMTGKRDTRYVVKSRIKKYSVSIVRGLLLFGLCFMIIQPMIIRFCTSLMVESDLYDSTIVLLPRHVTLDNYRIVADLTAFPKSMINTLWTSLLVSICQVLACTLVGYGFARYSFPLKKFWFACVVLLIIVPPQTIQTSLYVQFASFDFLGIFSALFGGPLNLRTSIIPYLLMSLTCMGLKDGLYIYMLRQYFKSIPKSLEEAAYVDGCSTMHTFVKIMLPDAIPTIASCFLFSFVWQWTDLFYSPYEPLFQQGFRRGPGGAQRPAAAADFRGRADLQYSADYSLYLHPAHLRGEHRHERLQGIKDGKNTCNSVRDGLYCLCKLREESSTKLYAFV